MEVDKKHISSSLTLCVPRQGILHVAIASSLLPSGAAGQVSSVKLLSSQSCLRPSRILSCRYTQHSIPCGCSIAISLPSHVQNKLDHHLQTCQSSVARFLPRIHLGELLIDCPAIEIDCAFPLTHTHTIQKPLRTYIFLERVQFDRSASEIRSDSNSI